MGRSSVDLYWIPLGAGGAGFVRLNGRVYEAVSARRERRSPLDLYHTALEVHVGGERFTIESAWPSPDRDTASRGVAVEGPVGTLRFSRVRLLRYEVRCWHDGIIPDVGEAVERHTLTDEPATTQRLLDLVPTLPALTWGRDELGTGDMWNSNSVVSWLLTRSGINADDVQPPPGGSAPGWTAGIAIARRGDTTD
jgi:hypothetical protein